MDVQSPAGERQQRPHYDFTCQNRDLTLNDCFEYFVKLKKLVKVVNGVYKVRFWVCPKMSLKLVGIFENHG